MPTLNANEVKYVESSLPESLRFLRFSRSDLLVTTERLTGDSSSKYVKVSSAEWKRLVDYLPALNQSPKAERTKERLRKRAFGGEL